MPAASSGPLIVAWIGACALALLAGCGSERRFGDDQGIPVAFSVHAERSFFSNLANHQWQPAVVAGAGISNAGAGGGVGFAFTFTSTTVSIIGGDAIGSANVFRQEVTWGDNDFTVPLRQLRRLELSVQAEGGREGWEALGTLIIPADLHPRVEIALNATGGHVRLLDDHGRELSPLPPPPPPANPQPPPPPPPAAPPGR